MTKKEREELEKEYINSYDKKSGCMIVLVYLVTITVLGFIMISIYKMFFA